MSSVLTLSNSSLPALRAQGIAVPAYDRGSSASGVLHFGPGAFHRVHQAYYFDELLKFDSRWGICEVALQSTSVRDALQPQDGLYTLCELDKDVRYRVIGSAREFLVARESSAAVLERFSAESTRLITATVTEKGYCLTAAGGLDADHPAIRRDLQSPASPESFVGYLVEGLRRRRKANLQAISILSCDNLSDNGARLRRAVIEFATAVDSELAQWIASEIAFPRTMVDSITPATDDILRARVAAEAGIDDRWPVQREAFTQWIVEDVWSGERPDLARVGVTVTRAVDVYEHAKLRLLNGAHSSLAYLGILAGHEFVADAMHNPTLSVFIDRLMVEIEPSVRTQDGFNVRSYAASLLQRFRNPALPHRLSQIAWDGSQKIPYRLLGTLQDNLRAGRSIECISIAIAAWFHFIRGRARNEDPPVDPLADVLMKLGSACTGEARTDVANFLALNQVFPFELSMNEIFRSSVTKAYRKLESSTPTNPVHWLLGDT